MNLDSIYSGKKIMVLGLAKSGYAVSNLLDKLDAKLVIVDSNDLEGNIEANKLIKRGFEVHTGTNNPDLIDSSFDYLVKNPGIKYTNSIVERALSLDIPVITEPEVAYSFSDATMVGVTGSNGKTTVTTLIRDMLAKSSKFKKSYYAGNIGIPISDVVEKATQDDVIVTELSSFQLEGTINLHPHVAVLNNIYSAHLDFHGNRDNYVKAKMNITKNQTEEDYFIVNWNDSEWQILSKISKAKVIPFSDNSVLENGAYVKDSSIYWKNEKVLDEKSIKVPGEHNVQNILAAVTVAKLFNVQNDDIVRVVEEFKGVKHRIQFVDEIDNVRYYNDSKATNIEATTVALQSFKQPINLIAGGLDRGNGFDELVPQLNNVVSIYLYGETKAKMKVAAEQAGIKNIFVLDTLPEAVKLAKDNSKKGSVVLLSPAAASWDQFDTFEQRGDLFIKEVEKLRGE
ncbi:UDP-N-acetylmuramoyl-L-alanine--D-glutamate ligase [Lactobacillus terrae]|uniref:UDP-N-acetylmuramoyl-L-alanine--D-glutamate ligase n=1 Tax=Lactobacillus terrae TaxID=2269374 RepID=UPI000C1B78C5|nr:UDP-N-acetylmuramoyl-L-alanine--D-glutamate ligase [Lactobacillus terrae]